MRSFEFIAEVCSTGEITLPRAVAQSLPPSTPVEVRLQSLVEETPRPGLQEFRGHWQDDRDAEQIVAEIYADRLANRRSERAVLE